MAKSIFLLMLSFTLYLACKAQTITVTGTVRSIKDSLPLANVSVTPKGSSNGIVTNNVGQFSINTTQGSTLVFSYVGYIPSEIVADIQPLDIYLSEATSNLEEVVVTALGIKRSEKALGYSTQKVNTRELVGAKTVDVGTKLTGKIAGLNVKNSTEFNGAPQLELRGSPALLVVDGVPFPNLSLRDIAPDDIENLTVLKGATASALYGFRGANGAIMIETKRGKTGFDVSVNSSSMFTSGFLALPKVQTGYSTGTGGKYLVGDYVWGDKLDIGRTASQYNPYTYEMETKPLESIGKNNLDNFLETSYILNNNISVSQRGQYGGARASFTHVRNKGQYPNTLLNKYTFALAGDAKIGKFSMEAGFTYNKRYFPNDIGTGYSQSGLLYNLLVWSGTEFDIRDYKNYWVKGKEDIQQNWFDKSWYNSPYYIANEMLRSTDYDVTNAFLTNNYSFTPWLKATLRSGLDYYAEKVTRRNPIGTLTDPKGSYGKTNTSGYSLNNDLLLLANHEFGNFGIDGLLGGTIYYWNSNSTSIATQNGLSMPGYYSIYASVDPARADQSQTQRQVNSAYGKATFSWRSELFVDVTGRNDWSSTLSKNQQSYFYPSVAASWVASETFHLPEVFNLLKFRGSWTQSKVVPGVYDINTTYSVSPNTWNGLTAARYPTLIRGFDIEPEVTNSFETGLAASLLRNRLKIDFTYYRNLNYNRIISASVSGTSGFTNTYVNYDEQLVRKGYEVTIMGTILDNADWKWDATFNWSLSHRYYYKLDDEYSTDQPWVKKGARYDWISVSDYNRAPDGSIIHTGGLPQISQFPSFLGFSDPKFITGITNNVQWKNFGLSFTVDGRIGGIMYNTINQAMWNSGAHIESDNQYRYDQVVNGLNNYVGQGVVLKSGTVQRDPYGNIIAGTDTRVFEANTIATSYESYTKTMNPYIGAPRIQNYFAPTFLKLRDLSISYNLPASASKKIGMKDAAISLVGQNLLLWTKEFKHSDPDIGLDNINSPSIRYMGVNLKFSF